MLVANGRPNPLPRLGHGKPAEFRSQHVRCAYLLAFNIFFFFFRLLFRPRRVGVTEVFIRIIFARH